MHSDPPRSTSKARQGRRHDLVILDEANLIGEADMAALGELWPAAAHSPLDQIGVAQAAEAEKRRALLEAKRPKPVTRAQLLAEATHDLAEVAAVAVGILEERRVGHWKHAATRKTRNRMAAKSRRANRRR